jgi:pimeloyl-ACP methyl ester carboxylesterase
VLTTVGSSGWVAEKFGSSPPRVIALHGWGRSGVDFASILSGHDALAIHLPGFPPASEPPSAWSTADYADHLAGALEGMAPLVVVGHSFGGRVAVRLAARHPHLVRSLVLTGVPFTRVRPPKPVPLAFRAAKVLHAKNLIPEATMERYRRRYGSADYRAARGVMRDILVTTVAEDYLADAQSVNAPVIMVWGERDEPAPVAAAQKALEHFPHATLRVVPGAGHLLEGSLEEGVAQAVNDALTQ